MPDTATGKTDVDVNTDTGNNGKDGTVDHSTTDDKNKSVPLATFLDIKNKAKQLEDDLKSLKDAEKAREQAKLKEDGKLQELITAKETELSQTKSELEKAKAEAEESKSFKAAKVEEYKTKLGDKWVDEYKNLSLIALDKLVNSLTLEGKNINVDKGSKGDEVKIELTEEQKKTARAMYPYYAVEKAYEYYTDNLIKTGKIKKEK